LLLPICQNEAIKLSIAGDFDPEMTIQKSKILSVYCLSDPLHLILQTKMSLFSPNNIGKILRLCLR
jgi:hypothetical protein